MIFHQDWEKFESVFNPKVKGAWNLSLLTENMNLDFTIYFSSISSIIGSPGQSNYAAANFFLDSLSRFRNSKGQPTICINWGPWSNVGMAARSSSTNIDSNKAIGKITPAQGKYFLNDRNHTQTGILPVNWEEFKTNLKNFGNFPFFSKIIDFENSEDKINKIPVLIEKLNNSAVNDHYEKVVEGLGGHGEFVTKDEEIIPALERALARPGQTCAPHCIVSGLGLSREG